MNAERVRALIVDQDEDTRLMYGEYLKQSFVDIDEASDGRDALAKALARPYDVIVTETRLPGISGLDLCELLRRDLSTRVTPIIVVTGDASSHNLERVREAGADTVLAKPCLPDVLLTEMRRLIRRTAELQQQSAALRVPSAEQVSHSRDIRARAESTRRQARSRLFNRADTMTPPSLPPALLCPGCGRALVYQRSHVGGVSQKHAEQWDYYECARGCGMFQYRHRTRKLRKLS